MKKTFLKQQKALLEQRKKDLLKQLSGFAHKSKDVKGDWITNYPKFDSGSLEDTADEVEEYGNILPVSYALELELKKIDEALEKIKKQTYGICGKCGQPIPLQRLKVYPQAEYCIKCK